MRGKRHIGPQKAENGGLILWSSNVEVAQRFDIPSYGRTRSPTNIRHTYRHYHHDSETYRAPYCVRINITMALVSVHPLRSLISNASNPSQGGFILAIIAIFLPPLTVLIRTGCGLQVLVSIVLTLLAWIPGVIHAWFIILEYPSYRKRRQRRQRSGEKVIVKG